MSKDKPELYAIGEKVQVEDSGNYKDGTVIVVYNETAGLLGQSACSTRDPSRVSKLPPWEPKRGEVVYVRKYVEEETYRRYLYGLGVVKKVTDVDVTLFEDIESQLWNVRPITDDYASVGKPWKDEE